MKKILVFIKKLCEIKSKKTAVTGIVLAALSFFAVLFSRNIFFEDDIFQTGEFAGALIMLPAAFLLTAVSFKLSEKIRNIPAIILVAVTPFICMGVSVAMYGSEIESAAIYMYNVLFYVIFTALMLLVSRNSKITVITVLAVNFVYHAINNIVVITRGLPITPSDILALQTALGVAGNYTLSITHQMIFGFSLSFLTAVLAWKIPVVFEKKRTKNIVLALSSAGIAALSCIIVPAIDCDAIEFDKVDSYVSNVKYGVPLNLYNSIREMRMEKPKGYNEEKIVGMLEESNERVQEAAADGEPVNIIAVMNESFADICLSTGFETDRGPSPFFDSLEENTVSGELLVSVCGGGTCNSEFEFLTGMSMGFMPKGSFPYLQYINEDIPSLAWHLKSLGYAANAYHPYYDYSWNRADVYKYLGFDEFIAVKGDTEDENRILSDISYDSFTDEPEFIREFISDQCTYKRFIKDFEARDKNKPWFSFIVTVQNHGGYLYDNEKFPADIHITNADGDVSDAEQYLTLINESDKALESLIEYLRGCPEKTIVLFFGDHQPELQSAQYDNGSGNVNLMKYVTPFKIWANYDIEEQYIGLTSLNYLSMILLDTAGMQQPDYNILIEKYFEKYPSISVFGAFDTEGQWHYMEDIENDPVISEYRSLAYYTVNMEE